ncbi:PREDICTED: serine/arginine repetitive matrix protein 1-like [Ipomoea nil]|uniref:serine/arginine repetitive matrix protein 1-like n=1 Tax=Ipomoea nil TaxID=35883 RepID=UPI0009015411|nr:PREDICTED: serine/arginine repetitive matrix protein 1-like [Ipomoea nil]XP_019185831.1 PREDICTED: serine/arginine repetitive matrix protein 1-like [Ipomoea nil]
MAEDNTNSSMSSETSGKNESDGRRPIKSSTEKARRLSNVHGVLPSDSLSSCGSDDGISSRRYSTGKQNPGDNGQTNLPHYLRASTGSCHDLCKYGRKHSSESKPTIPLSRRIKRPLHRNLNSEGATVGEGTKVTVPKQRPSDPSRDPELHFPSPPEIIKEVVFLEPKEVKHDSSSDTVMPKTDTKIKNMSVKCSPPRPQAKVSKQSSVNKSLEGAKPAARRVSDTGLRGNSDILSRDTKTGRKTVAPKASRPRVVEPPPAPPTLKSFVSKSRKRMDNSSASVKNKNKIEEADTKTKEENVSEKTLHVIEMEPKDDLVEPDQDGGIMEEKDDDDDVVEPAQDGEILAPLSPPSSLLPESSSTSNSHDLQIERNPRKSLTKAKRVVSKLDAPSPVKLKFRRGKVVDIRQENNAPRRLSFRKRTLLGKNQDSKSEGKGKLVESMHDGQKISSHPPSREKGGQDSKEGSGRPNSKGDDNKPALNIKAVRSAGRTQNKTSKKFNPIVSRVDNPLPVKLKFKRGTVVNPQHESTTPRKLGFRKVRLLRENQGTSRSDVKKNSKKRVESGENSTSLNPGKVVLRHQDVQQGKKDAQGLFNNVIEETASKLVETKKSKVKALVGAFETVISLQEKKKPSAHAVS